MDNVAVIVPYYQRSEGILVRALESVKNQELDCITEIIIVDDGSPVSAESELQRWGGATNRIKLLTQNNSGAGAARNAGLNAVGSSIRWVAFLDSDDEWLPGHIDNAITALQFGYDFYFSDFYFSDFKDQSAFDRAKKIIAYEHRLLDSERQIYEYIGNFTDQIMVKGNVVGTSNVVYDVRVHSGIRFREEYYNGQDYYFWLDISENNAKIVFSSRKECDCGVGINIYAGASWGSSQLLGRLINELTVWQAIAQEYGHTKPRINKHKQRLARLRDELTKTILHRILHGKIITWRDYTRIRSADLFYANGVVIFYAVRLFVYKVYSRVRGH